MTLTFRNLVTDISDPVSQWPTEAVVTALERGDIRDWARLAAEIRRSPWGCTARQVEEVLSHSRPFGTSELFEDVIARSRVDAEDTERTAVTDELAHLVALSGLTRGEFARRMGTSASRLSTYLSGRVVPSATLMVRARRPGL